MARGVKTGGRQKGTPNKTTAVLKDAILGAFEEAGGQGYLLTVAQTDPKTFCGLLGKVLPMQLSGEDGDAIQIEVSGPRDLAKAFLGILQSEG